MNDKFIEVNERVKISTATSIAWRKAFAWCTTALLAVFIYEGIHSVILKYQTAKMIKGLAIKDETKKTNDEYGKLILELQKEKRQRIFFEQKFKEVKKKSNIEWSK